MVIKRNKNASEGFFTDMSNKNGDFETLNELTEIKSEIYSADQLFEMVENLILKRDFKLLPDIFTYLLKKFVNDKKNKLILTYYQARSFNAERKVSIALDIIDEGISNLLELSEIDNELKNLLHFFYVERYHCYFIEGKYEEALNYYNNLLDHDFPDISDNVKLYIYYLIATIYFEQGNYINAIETNNEALKIAQAPNFSKYLPIILNQIGTANLAMNKLEVSVETYKLSLSISEKQNNHYYISKNLIDIALVLYFQNQINEDEFFQKKYDDNFEKLHKIEIFNKIMDLIQFKDYSEEFLLDLIKKNDNSSTEIKYKITLIELLIEKNIRKLQLKLSSDQLDSLYEKISLMELIAREHSLITTVFKSKLLIAKYFLVRSSFQYSKDILKKAITRSKKLKLPKYTKLFEVEVQKAQMNSILFGKIKHDELVDSVFSKQHINELFHYLYNFHYFLSKYE
ncbi:MAG: hypothetical protein ACW967_10185 [Candidatus Hodarchaeales archaeon]|jgi:tetratricopeptide (TPR) repeat protein